ncbi:MAG: PAS domain S-box protein [Carboxylicivirga sp.]|nr:PAS domain S-box protein [Carboxylicivirga sp.]
MKSEKPTYDELLSRVNILEKENAQYKLREKFEEPDQRFKSIVDNMIVGLAIASPDGKLMIMNKAFVKITGYSEAELLGMDFKEFTHPDDVLREQALLTKAISSESQDICYEKRYVTKQGQTVWVSLSVSYIEGTNPYFIGVINDVTEQKKTYKLLRKREKEFRSLYNNTPVMMHAIDLNGDIITVNDYWLQRFKYKRSDVIGSCSKIFLTENSKKLADERIPQMFKEGEIKNVEYEFLDKDGQIVDVLLNAKVQYDEEGQASSAFAIMKDITEQKKAKQKIIHQNKQLKELNATKDKFMSIIAHDLRSPFNSIIGFAELLLSKVGAQKDSEIKKYSDIILQSANHCNTLLSNLLNWALAQTGRINMVIGNHNLYEILSGIIQFNSINSDNKRIKLNLNCDVNQLIKGDKSMIETVVRNLISNAIKFTSSGGSVSVTAKDEDNNTQIIIRDTGLGISKEALENLFEIDCKQNTIGTNQETGTGLGLILCKEFLEMQGGQIKVHSKKGEGSTFIVIMPQ